MAKVLVQVAGGDIQQKEARSVGELRDKVQAAGYQAMVDGEVVDDFYQLVDLDEGVPFVTFTKKTKGA